MDQSNKVTSIEERIPRLKELRRRNVNRRLIFYISLFFLLISLIVYSQSPLSNVQEVVITGNIHNLSKQKILTVSDLAEPRNFLEVDEQNIKNQLLKIEQIKAVNVTKKWFNVVQINIEEHPHLAYIHIEGNFYPVIDNGIILDEVSGGKLPFDAPILINWVKSDVLQTLLEELNKIDHGIVNRISEIHYRPSELDPWRIVLFMNDGYEVIASLGNFSENISYYPSILEELKVENYPAGIIHLEVGSYFEYADEQ